MAQLRKRNAILHLDRREQRQLLRLVSLRWQSVYQLVYPLRSHFNIRTRVGTSGVARRLAKLSCRLIDSSLDLLRRRLRPKGHAKSSQSRLDNSNSFLVHMRSLQYSIARLRDRLKVRIQLVNNSTRWTLHHFNSSSDRRLDTVDSPSQ